MFAMCNQESQDEPPPIPERSDSLPDNITFIVGPDEIPFQLDRRKLADSNRFFLAMLSWDHNKTVIELNDINDRAFDNLIRCVYYKSPVKLQTVRTALDSLCLAHEHFCVELVKDCVKYLDSQLRLENVLEIYQIIRCLNKVNIRPEYARYQPTAPSYEDVQQPNQHQQQTITKVPDLELEQITKETKYLHKHCLQLIDQNAEEILIQEQLEDISSEALEELLTRDTFNVDSGESGIHDAVCRWAKRKSRSPSINLREGISDSIRFIPRYLLMSTSEIGMGPTQSGLLDQSEIAYLFKQHHKKKYDEDITIPKSLQGRMDYLKRVRVKIKSQNRPSSFREFFGLPWTTKNKTTSISGEMKLKEVSHSRTNSFQSDSKRKNKKLKKKEQEYHEEEEEETVKLSPKRRSSSQSSLSTCVVDCLCRVLSCLFD